MNNRRSLVYVGNLIDAIITCLTHPNAKNQTFLISDGEDPSTPDLIRKIAYYLDCPSNLLSFPPSLLKVAGNLGDVGSTVLGATIGIVLLNNPNPGQLWSALPITLPLIGDAIYTLIRRLLKRDNIFQAHRTHLYQRLQQSGWTHSEVAIAYLLLTSLIALLISILGSLGSGLSGGLVMGAIALGELYLQIQKEDPR